MWFITVGFVCLCVGWKVRGYLERVLEYRLGVREDRPLSVWDVCLYDCRGYHNRGTDGS